MPGKAVQCAPARKSSMNLTAGLSVSDVEALWTLYEVSLLRLTMADGSK